MAGIDPVESLSKGFDSLIPTYNELRHTGSSDIYKIAIGLKNYGDLITEIPDIDKGGVHEYAKTKGLPPEKELGLHVALLDAYISNNKDIKVQTRKVAGLVLGEAQESNNPDAIHFPNLIPAIDIITSKPDDLPESVLDKKNIHAFEIENGDRISVSSAKAMIFGGLLWNDLSEEQRVLMLEDFLSVSIATTDYVNNKKNSNIDPRVNVNNGIASVLNHGMFRQLIPIVHSNGGKLEEIVDVVLKIADRRSGEKRGPSNSFPDKSPREVVLQNLNFALQQAVVPSSMGNKDYPNPNESIKKVQEKISSL